MRYFLLLALLLGCAAGDEVCVADGGCDDEASLLASRHATIRLHAHLAVQHALRRLFAGRGDTLTLNETTACAALFTRNLLIEPGSQAAVDWNAATSDMLDCQITEWEGGTCDPSMDTLTANLEAVPGKNGYACSAEDIIAVGSQLQFNDAETYAATYAVSFPKQDKISQLVLYTNTSGVIVTLDGVSMKNAVWKAGCTASLDAPKCVDSPNVLSWSMADGNPSSAKLDFRFMWGGNYELPENAYDGPFFVGSISATDPVSTDSNNDAVGVIYQNDVVNCGNNDQLLLVNFSTWMVQGAPQACVGGVYCLDAVDNATGDAAPDSVATQLENFTVEADTIALGGVAIPEYTLSNSEFTWKASPGQPYSGSMLIYKAPGLTQVSGVVKKGSTVYNITGYTPPEGKSCYKAPAKDNGSWWDRNKKYFGMVRNGLLQGAGFVMAEIIIKKVIMPALSWTWKKISGLFKRKKEVGETPEGREAMNEKAPDEMSNPEQSPEVVEANNEADKVASEQFGERQAAAMEEAELAKAEAELAKNEELLAENPPEAIAEQLEAENARLADTVQMQEDAVAQAQAQVKELDAVAAEAEAEIAEEAELAAEAEAEEIALEEAAIEGAAEEGGLELADGEAGELGDFFAALI